MNCPSCTKQVRDGSIFCHHCGAEIGLQEPSPQPTNPFSPSELILLNGEQFAQKAGLFRSNVELFHIKVKVSTQQLGQAILAAGVLANEQAGAIRLEVRHGYPGTLLAVPCKRVAWPADSLESEVFRLARVLPPGEESDEVSAIIWAWIRGGCVNPWLLTVGMVAAGLAARGLLETDKAKRLADFFFVAPTRYVLPERTASLVAQQPVEPIRQLLWACQQNRPQVWDLLVKQIEAAVNERRREAERQARDWD